MKTKKNVIICVLASIIFVIVSIPYVVHAESAYSFSNDNGTYEYTVVSDSSTLADYHVGAYMNALNGNTYVFFVSNYYFTVQAQPSNTVIKSSVTDGYYCVSSVVKSAYTAYTGFAVRNVTSRADALKNFKMDFSEPTEPSTEEPTEPSTEEPQPPFVPELDSDIPVNTYLNIFLQMSFWYGAELATLLSFVGYGVFKAISLLNINNKH